MPETTVATEQRTLNIPITVKELVEAMVFASSEPLTVKQLKNILAESGQVEGLNVESVIDTINEEYQQANKPYRIARIAGGFQYSTVPEYAEWVGKLYKEQGKRKLSQSSLETLAIIAYRQPITRPDIEAIRGVDCDYVLGTLLEKKLVTISGRAPTPGRPLLYGTTELFLKHFGLNEITDLPKPREIEELLADSRYETERRMLEVQEQADAEKKKLEEEDFKSRLPHIPKKKAEMDDPVEIIHKKLNRELTAKKEDEVDKPTQEIVDQSKVEALEPQQLDPLQEKDLQDSIESSSDVQIDETPTIDMPVDYSPQVDTVEMTEDRVPVDSKESEKIEELENEAQESAPEGIAEGAIADEPAPEIEMSIHEQPVEDPVVTEEDVVTTRTQEIDEESIETELRLTEDLVSEEEEEEVIEESIPEPIIEEQSQQDEIADIQVVEPELEERTTTEEAPTESALTTVEKEEPPTNDITAEAPPEATFEAVPPQIAPIADEVRESIQSPGKPKSRWQQFKETVQGFLKKVFG